MATTKLKINGREVPVVANQMVFDFSDIDLGVLVEDTPRKRERPKCVCGSRSIGIQDYMMGHDRDCPVHEDRTPVMGYEP